MTLFQRRCGRLAITLVGLGALASAARGAEDLGEILAQPLACRFQAIALGQFRGLDYGPGVPSGTSVVTVAASADDLRQGRAALIEQERAAVARLVSTDKQALLVAMSANGDTSVLTLFFTARTGASLPASLIRFSMIGNVPVLAQSAGVCQAGEKTR